MSSYIRALCCMGVVGVTLLGALVDVTRASAQSVTLEDMEYLVRRVLRVFDHIVFRVARSTLYLAGYSVERRLKADAEGPRSARAIFRHTVLLS